MSVAPVIDITTGHISGEVLDLLLIGALSSPVANAVKAHLDECETCRARWRELNHDKQRFEEHVYARTLPKVVARSGSYAQVKRRSSFLRWVALGAAVVGALAVGASVAMDLLR